MLYGSSHLGGIASSTTNLHQLHGSVTPLSPDAWSAMAAAVAYIDAEWRDSRYQFFPSFLDGIAPSSAHEPSAVLPVSSSSTKNTALLRELLIKQYQTTLDSITNSSDTQDSQLSRVVAHASMSFARAESSVASPLIQQGALYAIKESLPTLADVKGSYLVGRIPPHVGHGVGSYFANLSKEQQQEEQEYEAHSDRTAAAAVLRALHTFLQDGAATSLESFLSKLQHAGEWRHWLTEERDPPSPHFTEEYIVGGALKLFRELLDLGERYEKTFSHPRSMSAPPPLCHWFELSKFRGHPVCPSRVPLFSAALAIAAQGGCDIPAPQA